MIKTQIGKLLIFLIAASALAACNKSKTSIPLSWRNPAVEQTVFKKLLVIGDGEDAKNIVGFNVATGESFHVATLDGPGVWWLTASGTMC